MRHRRIAAILVLLLSALPALAATEVFDFDKVHSSVGFRIRHVVSKVDGRFKDYQGKIWIDRANPSASKVEFTIQAASIDTGNDRRDGHLRSPDFFEVEKHPTITFKSTKVEAKGGDLYDVTGDLTIKGVTKSVKIPVKHGGFAKVGPMEKTGFDATITLNRKDFGISWNRAMDQGGVILGDEVDVVLGVEANKQMPEQPKPDAAAAPAKPGR